MRSREYCITLKSLPMQVRFTVYSDRSVDYSALHSTEDGARLSRSKMPLTRQDVANGLRFARGEQYEIERHWL